MSVSVQHDVPTARNRPVVEEMPHDGTRIVPSLLSVCKVMRALNGIKLWEAGFHNGQDELLHVLAKGPLGVSVIADRLRVRPSTVSKMSDRLIEKGLIERITDKRDARKTVLTITDAGIDVQASLAEAQIRFDRDLTRSIDPSKLSDIAVALEELDLILTARLRRIR